MLAGTEETFENASSSIVSSICVLGIAVIEMTVIVLGRMAVKRRGAVEACAFQMLQQVERE